MAPERLKRADLGLFGRAIIVSKLQYNTRVDSMHL